MRYLIPLLALALFACAPKSETQTARSKPAATTSGETRPTAKKPPSTAPKAKGRTAPRAKKNPRDELLKSKKLNEFN